MWNCKVDICKGISLSCKNTVFIERKIMVNTCFIKTFALEGFFTSKNFDWLKDKLEILTATGDWIT